MTRFHINSKGVPSICRAKKGNCPFGGHGSHFETEIEAQDYVDKVNEERFGILENIDSDNDKIYDVPNNTPSETYIDKDLFLKENHSLKRSGEVWVHLDNEGVVIGTMQEPIILMRENGELMEIADGENKEVKDSISKLKALKLMSKFGLVSQSTNILASSVNLYTPTHDFNEYKTTKYNQASEQEKNSLEAFELRMAQRGGNKTKDLFSDGKGEISRYFRSDKDTIFNPVSVEYNPDKDNWKVDVPSADNFAISAYQEKGLDIQRINNKWAITDDKGAIYGRLDNPAVVVNFDSGKIEFIGEAGKVEEKCRMAENDERFTKNGNRMLNRIGMLKMDNKSRDLGQVRNLFKYSWAFREQ